MVGQTKVSIDRIHNFISEKEKKYLISQHPPKESNIAVEIEPGDYAWDVNDQYLECFKVKISEKIKIKKGHKVAICGSVGSEKSSLLCSILGEIPKISGNNAKVYGSKAFVPQSAWIQVKSETLSSTCSSRNESDIEIERQARNSISLAKYCAKKLPLTTKVLTIHNGKVIFTRFSTSTLPCSGGDPKPSVYVSETPSCKDGESEFDESEISDIERNSHENIQRFEDGSLVGYKKDEQLCSFERQKKSLNSVSTFVDSVQEMSGWPLFQAASIVSPTVPKAIREMPVVHWIMNLANRSSPATQRSSSSLDLSSAENFLGRESSNLVNKDEIDDNSKSSYELPGFGFSLHNFKLF